MKPLHFLAIAYFSVLAVHTVSASPKEETLLQRASAQLERLAPYRRSMIVEDPAPVPPEYLEDPKKNTAVSDRANEEEETLSFQIYQILPEIVRKDGTPKIESKRGVMEILNDPKYMALIQERIKRSEANSKSSKEFQSKGYDGGSYAVVYDDAGHGGHGGYESYGAHGGGHGSYGGYDGNKGGGLDSGSFIKGSSGFISGIAGGLIGGIVSASATGSKTSAITSAQGSVDTSAGSAMKKKPDYGPIYHHHHHPPQHVVEHVVEHEPEHAPEHEPEHVEEHESGYSYHDHKKFDVWDFKKAIINTLVQAVKAISGGVIALKGQLIKGGGFLVSTKGKIISTTGEAITSLGRHIAKSAMLIPSPHASAHHKDHDSYEGPPPSGEEHSAPAEDYHGSSNYASSDDDDHAGLLIVKPSKPDSSDHEVHHPDLDPHSIKQEITYDVPHKGSDHKDVLSSHPVASDTYHGLTINHGNHVESVSSFDHPPPSYDSTNHYSIDYSKIPQTYPLYPPSSSGTKVHHSVEYTPIRVSKIRYTPTKYTSTSLETNGDHGGNDLSIVPSLSIGLSPQLESLKISALNHNGLELPSLQSQTDFHGSGFSNAQDILGSQEPLRIPVLNAMPLHYWQNQGLLHQPTSFGLHGLHRRRSIQRRRLAFAPKNTRLHRV